MESIVMANKNLLKDFCRYISIYNILLKKVNFNQLFTDYIKFIKNTLNCITLHHVHIIRLLLNAKNILKLFQLVFVHIY